MKNFYLSTFLVIIFISHTYSQNTFPSSGAVGIGTTNPTSMLHVMGTTTNGYGLFLLQDNVQSAATARNYLTFADFTGLRMGYFGAVGDGNITLGSDNSRNIVLTGGNVGAGTTSPSTKIHVYGTLTIDPLGQSYNNYSEGIRVGAASNGYAIITFGVNTAVPYGAQSSQWWLGKDGSDNGFNICGVTPGNAFHITPSGNVGVGTINPDAKLTVNGTVHSKEVKVDLNVPGPDYVFEKDYELKTLAEVNSYITKNKHLPEIPSAKTMERNGVDLSEMNMQLLKKIEELTLYLIANEKDKKEQNEKIESLEKQVKIMKAQNK